MPTIFNLKDPGDEIEDTDFEQFITPVNNIELGLSHFCVGTAFSDDYEATISPDPPSTWDGDAAGYWIHFKPDVANVGACTLSLNGSSSQSIKTKAGADPSNGTLIPTGIYTLVFDGTNFVIL